MTLCNKKAALEQATRIVNYIEKDELTKEEKDLIVKESILNFNENVNPGWLEYRKSVSTDATFVEWTDSVDHFEDLYGNEFIDCLGGFGIFTCGHRNPEILKTVKAQLDRYALHSQELVDPLRGYLANTLAQITPGDLQYCFFTNGGAEAIEMALKLARLATGGKYYISTIGAFHGKSYGAISMGGKGAYRQDYLPMIQQVQHVEYGNAEAMETAIKNLIHNPWILGSPTFGGNPLACSAALSTIKFMLEHDIPKMAKEKGEYFMVKLEALKKKYPTVLKEVRGAGLLICMEFPEAEVGYEITKGLFARKVMTAGTLVNAKTVRIEPPAVLSYEKIDLVMERLEESIIDAKKEFKL